MIKTLSTKSYITWWLMLIFAYLFVFTYLACPPFSVKHNLKTGKRFGNPDPCPFQARNGRLIILIRSDQSRSDGSVMLLTLILFADISPCFTVFLYFLFIFFFCRYVFCPPFYCWLVLWLFIVEVLFSFYCSSILISCSVDHDLLMYTSALPLFS